jgi:hypothetical protein
MGDDPTCTGARKAPGAASIDQGGRGHAHAAEDWSVSARPSRVQLVPRGADRRIDKPDLCQLSLLTPGESPHHSPPALAAVLSSSLLAINGGSRIRTCEGVANAFTARPL